jgi:biotin transport system substrate-specific component
MKSRVSDLTFISLFAALTAGGAFIKIPVPYVPLTLQTLMVMFAGLVLGSRRGAMSQLLYLAIGLIGLPIFAHGGGPGYVLQPSFGFLVGFIPGAYLIGKIVENEPVLKFPRVLAALLVGQAAIYLIGISYLHFVFNFIIHKPISLSATLAIGLFAFIPGDIIKTIIAAAVLVPIRRRLIILSK